MKNDDFQGLEAPFYQSGNPLRRLLRLSLDLLGAEQAGILYGTNRSRTRFLPTSLWDRGIIDMFHGRGLKGFLLRSFGRTVVTVKKLSPVFFYRPAEAGPEETEGLIAYTLRNCADYYEKGISVFISPDLHRQLAGISERYAHIPFFVYDGRTIQIPEERITVDTHIIRHFKADSYVTIYIPNYGILVLNTVSRSLLEVRNGRIVSDEHLKQRLDILIRLVETASLAALGNLRGGTVAELLSRKEKHLRQASAKLIENERRFRDLYENAPVAYLSLDRNGRIQNCNNQAHRLLGYDTSDLIGRTMESFDTDGSRIKAALADAAGIRHGPGQTLDSEVRLRIRDRREIWVNLSVEAIRDRHHDIQEFRVAATDITERRKAQEALRNSEARFRDLAEMLPEAVFETGPGLALTYANRRAFDLFGYTQDDLKKGLFGTDLLVPEDRDRAEAAMTARLNGTIQGPVEYQAIRKNGTTFPALVHTNVVLRNAQATGLRGILIDLTEQKRMEMRFIEKNHQLKRLNEHLISIEEKERGHAASELHDSVVQTLGMCLSRIKTIQEDPAMADPEGLKSVRTLIEQSVAELRNLIYDLSPPILNHFGIGAVLAYLVEESNRKYQASISLINHLETDLHLEMPLKITLYRAVAELILNIVRHSGTRTAQVDIFHKKRRLIVKVTDKGSGFDMDQYRSDRLRGFGIYRLRERIDQLGGKLRISSALGKGTTILLVAPLP